MQKAFTNVTRQPKWEINQTEDTTEKRETELRKKGGVTLMKRQTEKLGTSASVLGQKRNWEARTTCCNWVCPNEQGFLVHSTCSQEDKSFFFLWFFNFNTAKGILTRLVLKPIDDGNMGKQPHTWLLPWGLLIMKQSVEYAGSSQH